MNIAFLFNSDHNFFSGSYGDPIRAHILASGILQTCERSKRFAEGDITTYGRSPTLEGYKRDTLAVMSTTGADLVLRDKAAALLPNITVCVFLLQNMSLKITNELHQYLLLKDWYLGALEVNFSTPAHLVYFRNFLAERGRLQGGSCRLYFSMGDLENTEDIHLIKQFEDAGFSTKYIDSGARRTIFDDYDTLEHFQRIDELRNFIKNQLKVNPSIAEEIIHNLEETHPKLFEPLHAITKTLKQAKTTEEFAMAGLGCRRFMKLLTDAWFPAPKSGLHNGRAVSDNKVKNRFWAHLSSNLKLSSAEMTPLGKNFEILWEKASKYLHEGDPTLLEVQALTKDILFLVSEVISLDIDASARPYSAYSLSIKNFWLDVQKDMGDGDE